jgi:hypothetical protein
VGLGKHFARNWLDDARREARNDGRDARRREIVFAACFVESYLVEWVRDRVYRDEKDRLEKTEQLLARPIRTGIEKRLKKVVRQLKEQNRITSDAFNCSGGWWQDFGDLVELRNWLVDGRASIPARNGRQLNEHSLRSLLDSLQPEWAVKTALEVTRQLDSATGTESLVS